MVMEVQPQTPAYIGLNSPQGVETTMNAANRYAGSMREQYYHSK
jgi:hypothetical protein